MTFALEKGLEADDTAFVPVDTFLPILLSPPLLLLLLSLPSPANEYDFMLGEELRVNK